MLPLIGLALVVIGGRALLRQGKGKGKGKGEGEGEGEGGDLRDAHMRELSLDEQGLSEAQQIANKHFRSSLTLLASTTACALLYPPALLLHLPVLLYQGLPFHREAYQDLVEGQRVTARVVDSTLHIGTMVFAPVNRSLLVLGALSGVFMSYSNKISTEVKDTARRQLSNLMGQQPRTVWRVVDGVECETPFEAIGVGDLVVVVAGESIPIDGEIIEGDAMVDQQLLTGEATPVEKLVGDTVFAGTLALTGRIIVRVDKTAEQTVVAQIGEMLLSTADFTSSLELRGKQIADSTALPTLAASALTLPFVGHERALAILYSGIGYNMKTLGPLSLLSHLRRAAREGILIKDGRALEQLDSIDMVVFDKTGTLTLEQPTLGAIHVAEGFEPDIVLARAASAEQRQSHPLARAILFAAEQRQLELGELRDAAYEVGAGLRVQVDDQLVLVGSERLMSSEGVALPGVLVEAASAAQDQGCAIVYVAIDGVAAGVLELQPTLRPEAKSVVEALHARGVHTCVLSGDSERATHALASTLGVDRYFAEISPAGKAEIIEALREEGHLICYVGDGINDAIALKTANVSVSLRGAAYVATDTAKIVLMDQTLGQFERVFELSSSFEANMRVNFATTVVPGVLIISGALLGVVDFAGSILLFGGGLMAGALNSIHSGEA